MKKNFTMLVLLVFITLTGNSQKLLLNYYSGIAENFDKKNSTNDFQRGIEADFKILNKTYIPVEYTFNDAFNSTMKFNSLCTGVKLFENPYSGFSAWKLMAGINYNKRKDIDTYDADFNYNYSYDNSIGFTSYLAYCFGNYWFENSKWGYIAEITFGLNTAKNDYTINISNRNINGPPHRTTPEKGTDKSTIWFSGIKIGVTL